MDVKKILAYQNKEIQILNLEKELNGQAPDYLVVLHMEPDHSYNIGVLAEKYPEMKIVGNAKTFEYMKQFFEISTYKEFKWFNSKHF